MFVVKDFCDKGDDGVVGIVRVLPGGLHGLI